MAKSISIPITGNAAPLRKVLSDTEGRLSAFGGRVGGVFKGLAGVGSVVVGAAGAAGGALVALGSHFDGLENTIVRGTGASGDALDDLVQSTQDVLKTVPDSGEVVAQTLADVNTFFGQTGTELEATTTAFLDFARVTGTDTAKAIGAVDAALTQFGEDAGNTDEVLGDLVRISQATGAPMDQLLSQMETFGPIFANAGFHLEETGAIMGMLEQAGVSVTRIGPAMNKFFRDVAKEGGRPQDALQDTVGAIKNAGSEMEALAIASEAFGAEGAQRLTNAIRSGNFEIETFNGLLGEGAGVVGQQANQVATLSDKFNQLKNMALVGLAPLAEAAFDGVMKAIDAVMPFAQRIMDAFGEGGLRGAFGELQNVAAEVWPSVKTALVDFMKAAGNFIIDDALPWIAGKLMDLGQALVDWIGPRIRPMLEALGDFIATAANWLVEDGLPMMVDKLIELGNALTEWIKPRIVPALTALGEFVVTIANWLLTTALPKIAEQMARLGWAMVQWIYDLFPDLLRGLREFIAVVGRWITNEAIPQIFSWFKGLGRKMIDGIVDGIKAAAGKIGDALTSIPGVSQARDLIGAVGGILPFADGGIVTGPTLGLIGEAGPEAVIPLDRMDSMGGTYNITVNMPPGSDGRDVVEALRQYTRRYGALPIPVRGGVR